MRRYKDARLSGAVNDYERRRFTRRIFGALVLCIVLAMTYFGYTNIGAFLGYPWFFALYWLTSIILALSLIILAVLDAREVFKYTIRNYMDEGGEEERLERFLSAEKAEGKEPLVKTE